jgi:hypothetical protein
MSSRSRHAPAILVAALACTWLPAGCAQDLALPFRSQRIAATAPVQRLQVYAPIATGEPANPVTRVMYDAFQASLVLRLALCEVRGTVSPSAGDLADPDAGPTHTLRIRIADRQIVETRLINQFHQHYATTYSGTLYFGLELEDAGSHAPVWSARSSFKFPTGYDDEENGSGFARGIVTQLQRDGLLTRCVQEEYPGCLADRREGFQRTARIPDSLERAKAVKRLPVCR